MNQTNSSSPTKATSKPASQLISTKNMVLGGMFTALLAIISQISIPMPTGMPITIQVFGITLVGVVLGWKLGLMSTIVYILLGAVGLPIFANFQGGVYILTGITGGYILSWPVMVALCGIKPKTSNKTLNTGLIFVFALLGLAFNEFAGGLQWAALAGDMSIWAVFTYSMVAFVPKDIIITILAVIIGMQIRKTLIKSGYLSPL